jgi:Cu(I)/Ag(I) efflux system membrane fusion protein
MLRLRTVAGLCLLAALVVFAGCAKEESKTPPATPKAEEQKTDSASAEKTAAELPDGLKELSPEDLAAVQKQKVCPVSGEELGAMGKPYKVTVKGQTVFLCCSGCEDDLKKDPDKYLAKLKK